MDLQTSTINRAYPSGFNPHLRNADETGVQVAIDDRQLIGDSVGITAVRRLVARAARARTTVLLTGEKGSGKEHTARRIHSESPCNAGPFVKVCCGAWPAESLAGELFGESRNADTPGRLARAMGGTLFLDEIAATSAAMQVRLVRLIRALRDESISRGIGHPAAVRIIAATEHDLHELMQRGAFRQDLFYNLSVLPIAIPPLRARREDIPPLAEHFRRAALEKHGLPTVVFAPGCHERLAAARWRGNMRQLINIVERLVVLSDGPEISPRDVERELSATDDNEAAKWSNELSTSLAMRRFQAERSAILGALAETDGNRTKTASILGISRRSLYDKLAALGLRRSAG